VNQSQKNRKAYQQQCAPIWRILVTECTVGHRFKRRSL